MTIERRLTRMEDEVEALTPGGGTRIRVVRVPDDVGDLEAYLATHPEAISKSIEVPAR